MKKFFSKTALLGYKKIILISSCILLSLIATFSAISIFQKHKRISPALKTSSVSETSYEKISSETENQTNDETTENNESTESETTENNSTTSTPNKVESNPNNAITNNNSKPSNTSNTNSEVKTPNNTTETKPAEEKPSEPSYKTITLNVVTTYYGFPGYFTTNNNIMDVDLGKYGLDNGNSAKGIYPSEYYDVDTGNPIWFACDCNVVPAVDIMDYINDAGRCANPIKVIK